MNVIIKPHKLNGVIEAIPSKSYAHRILICAAFSDRPTKIKCKLVSEDILATVNCLKSLGAQITWENGVFTVNPIGEVLQGTVLNCNECGTTIRFLLPIVCAVGSNSVLSGSGGLAKRPLSPLYEELESKGIKFSENGVLPLYCSGKLSPGNYEIAANVSSQFVGGLLIALSLLDGESTLVLTNEIESKPYINMTLDVLKIFGAKIKVSDDFRTFGITGIKKFISPGEAAVEGDWSNSAFWAVLGALGCSIKISGLKLDSRQGDKAVIDILKDFGAEVNILGDTISVSAKELKGCIIDAKNVPDLIPAVTAAAVAAKGRTVVKNAGRLRIKESDRLKTVCELFKALGADISETEDGLIIEGIGFLNGGEIDSNNDHRIAMAGAVASVLCRNNVKIINANAVNKSYPKFFEDFELLGGKVDIEN